MPQMIEKIKYTGVQKLKGCKIIGCENWRYNIMDRNGVVTNFPMATNYYQSWELYT